MKFTEHLSAHLTPEWRKQYIEYEALKEILYKALEDFEELPVIDAITVHSHFNERDEIFFASCEIELEKINNFYAEKLAESKRKFCELKDTLDSYLLAQNRGGFKAGRSTQNISRLQSRSSTPGFLGSRASVAHLSHSRGKMNDTDTNIRRKPTLFSKNTGRPSLDNQIGEKSFKPIPKPHDLKLAFSEFYLSLILLQNYQSLNFTGFRKILKKHDKLFQRSNGLEWHRMVIAHEPFYVDNSADELITTVENIYTNSLESGNRQKAMKRLRVPPLADKYSHWSVFRFGLFAGIFFVQLVVIFISKIVFEVPNFSWPAFRLFRSVFLLDFFVCLLAVNVYGWRTSGVNHVLIFEIDPRAHLDHFQILELGFFLCDVWGAAVILCLFSERLQIPHLIAPLFLVLFMIVYLIQPFGIFHSDARRWLIVKFWRVIRAPFVQVKFPDFFIGDQLNSLSFLFPDVGFFFCFYCSCVDWSTMNVKTSLRNSTFTPAGRSPLFAPKTTCDGILYGLTPILKSLPAWFRFAQCLRRYNDLTVKSPVPHLLNAGKYATTLFVTCFTYWSLINTSSYVFAMLVIASFVNSVCTYSWDIIMDWGLLDRSLKDNRGLREQLVYRFRAYYYVAFLENLIIRFSWTFSFTFEKVGSIEIEIIKTILLFAEVIRRIIWNFFRLENEHLNNCGNFRAVRDIFVAPIQKPKLMVPKSNRDDIGKTSNSLSPTNNDAGDEFSSLRIAEQKEDDECAQNRHLFNRPVKYDSCINPEILLNEYASVNVSKSKSLWHFLQNLNSKGKHERRRQQGLEAVSTMERALREVNTSLPSYPSKNMSNQESNLTISGDKCYNNSDVGANQMKITTALGEDVTMVLDNACSNGGISRSSSLPIRKNNFHSRIPFMSNVERQIMASCEISETVHLSKNKIISESNRKKTVRSPVNSNKQPKILIPGEKISRKISGEIFPQATLESAISESSVERLSDESPNATALPSRTMFLARQLRSFLQNCGDQQTPVILNYHQSQNKNFKDLLAPPSIKRNFVRNPRFERHSYNCIDFNTPTSNRPQSVTYDKPFRLHVYSSSIDDAELDPSTSSSSIPSFSESCVLSDNRSRMLQLKQNTDVNSAASSHKSKFTIVPVKMASIKSDENVFPPK